MNWQYQPFLLIFLCSKTTFAFLKLFNTENSVAVQSYDCIYYTNHTAANNETIPYCIRTNQSIVLNRSFQENSCENNGIQWTFVQLKEMNITQDEVLSWNSSIERADRYAAYLIADEKSLANEQICNCSLNTFGKFCEYQFPTEYTFERTIEYQFYLKKLYRNGSQLWGNLTCYTTLVDCYFGLRCLTWQNICDGKQQCMFGIDEDHCDELEFNECEENEYRCEDGSCIPIEYWLDGQADCSDKKEEQIFREFLVGSICPLVSSRFNCDEANEHGVYFACGDGLFVMDFIGPTFSCYNFRFSMFFCELDTSSDQHSLRWTLKDGHCSTYAQINKNLTDLNRSEQCRFLLKCLLINDTNDLCNELIEKFYDSCYNQTIQYPEEPILLPYIQTYYNLNEIEDNREPNFILFNGTIKCVSSQTSSQFNIGYITWSEYKRTYPQDVLFCRLFNQKDLSQYCSESSKPSSFFCSDSMKCVSKHRLHDTKQDCIYDDDEANDQKCFSEKLHRLRCQESLKCLLTPSIGNRALDCMGRNDEYIIPLKWDLLIHLCTDKNTHDCNILKTHIDTPLSISTDRHDEVILFRQYCDTFFDLAYGYDESYCKQWICPENFYQCLNGQCVHEDIVIVTEQWQCADASDSIRLLIMPTLSDHNVRITNERTQLEYINKQFNSTDAIEQKAFFTFCNHSIEYGCILANVNNPLDFILNRPCIHLSKIGDGIIDCYGGLDERNILTCGKNIYQQRGFDFHCSDQECIPYQRLCKDRCSNNADYLLCEEMKSLTPIDCEQLTGIDACDSPYLDECDPSNIFNAYCNPIEPGSFYFNPYRLESWDTYASKAFIYPIEYPSSESRSVSTDTNIISSSKSIANEFLFADYDANQGREGWICGRGVAITRQRNQSQCLCPPSLYGEFCQYFSDRITIIISFKNFSSSLFEQDSDAIQIVAYLLSNDQIIDHYSFYLLSIYSKENNKKYRFNLIFQRPKLLSNHYDIQFEAYTLRIGLPIKFIAIWKYEIQFPFLPSYRFVKILTFKNSSLSSIKEQHICQISNPCLHNSTCYPLMNSIQNLSTYYCHCDPQTFGKHCEHVHRSLLICSKSALQRQFSSSKSICLCPIDLYGPTCHLNHTCVHRNPCNHNRGTCLFDPHGTPRDYICKCRKEYFGEHCEIDSAVLRINFRNFSFLSMQSNSILSSIIQLYNVHNQTLDIEVQEKRVYERLPSNIIEMYHNNYYLPSFGIFKVYHRFHSTNNFFADLDQPNYFLLYSILSKNIRQMNITIEINKKNFCPNTSLAFSKNFSNLNDLSEQDRFTIEFNRTEMIFQYHLLCPSFRCFHDDNYFCLCDQYDHAECFRYNRKLDQCDQNPCLANGQCLHGDQHNRTDFVCLCPECYYGSICQHNTNLFSFTVETLLTNDLHSTSTVTQKIFISLLIIIPVLFFIIGFLNNMFCFVTFNRSRPLTVGIGHYLRIGSIINQLTLLFLICKFLHIILSMKGLIVEHLVNTILCKILSYLLSCLCRISYWLMSMVAIERVYVIWFIKGTWLKNPRIANRIIIIIVLGILISDVNELIYYQSIEDPKSSLIMNSTWCVTSYPTSIIIYNQTNNILNYILPFSINIFSTIILIVLIIKNQIRLSSEDKEIKRSLNVTIRIYIQLITEKRELIIPPLLTMLPQLFSSPQFILSFSLACQDFRIHWHRYPLIIFYFITYLPQVMFYKLYISPSSFYTNEFHATKLYHRVNRWRRFFRSNI